jgi:hypothetical protein
MDDQLPLFGDDNDGPQPPHIATLAMTLSQREVIRTAFAQLEINDAAGQFAAVADLTGHHITSVLQLEEHQAQTLIYRLKAKIDSIGRKNTGNVWDDRDEETWIDRL